MQSVLAATIYATSSVAVYAISAISVNSHYHSHYHCNHAYLLNTINLIISETIMKCEVKVKFSAYYKIMIRHLTLSLEVAYHLLHTYCQCYMITVSNAYLLLAMVFGLNKPADFSFLNILKLKSMLNLTDFIACSFNALIKRCNAIKR